MTAITLGKRLRRLLRLFLTSVHVEDVGGHWAEIIDYTCEHRHKQCIIKLIKNHCITALLSSVSCADNLQGQWKVCDRLIVILANSSIIDQIKQLHKKRSQYVAHWLSRINHRSVKFWGNRSENWADFQTWLLGETGQTQRHRSLSYSSGIPRQYNFLFFFEMIKVEIFRQFPAQCRVGEESTKTILLLQLTWEEPSVVLPLNSSALFPFLSWHHFVPSTKICSRKIYIYFSRWRLLQCAAVQKKQDG